MIYGIHDDDIHRNRSSEIDTRGNCLLESLFYLLDPNKCDGLEKPECKKIKNEFSDTTRKDSLETLIKSFDKTATDLENLINTKEEDGKLFDPLNKKIDSEKIKDLREKAKILFQKQFDHTRAVLKLLNKMFNINYKYYKFSSGFNPLNNATIPF